MLKLNASIRFHFTEKKKDINEKIQGSFSSSHFPGLEPRAFVVSFIVDYP